MTDAANAPVGFAPALGSAMWIVMKALEWQSVKIDGGRALSAPADGPQKFLPVFTTREGALKWANGSGEILEIIAQAPNVVLSDDEK